MTDILYAGLCILTAGADPACPEIPLNQVPPAQVQKHKETKDVSKATKGQQDIEVLVNQSIIDSLDDESLN